MRILLRYQLKEIVIPLGAWVAFLYVLLLLMQFLRGSELLLGSAVTGGDLARVLLYLAPHFLVLAIPVALLLAILLGYGRLNDDREVMAMGSVGVGAAQLLRAPLAVAVSLSAVLMALAFTGEPWGMSRVKERVNEVIKRNMAGDVRPGVFYEDLTGLTLYVEAADPKEKKWRNVLIHDDRDPSSPLLVLAREGRVLPAESDEALRFSLLDGNVHRAGVTRDDYAVVSFERADIAVEVGEYIHQKNRFPRSPQDELTPGDLLRAADDAAQNGRDPKPFRMAFHGRIDRALAPIPFALLGTPLALSRGRGGRARGFLLTLLAYTAYYVVGRIFENMGLEGRLPVPIAAHLGAALFAALGVFALYRLQVAGTSR